MKAPFPYFGGKRRVAPVVWARLGDVDTYNEPFAGSLAVLLDRPHEPRVETVNDLDAMIANFWRALQHDPEQVAYYADGPVNEADLHARHRWLVLSAGVRAEQLMKDPHYFNVKVAGWWLWGQCLWIGTGWCAQTDKRNQTPYQQAKKPRVGSKDFSSSAEWKQLPDLTNPHQVGIASRRWQGGGQAGAGSGVHAVTLSRQLPALNGDAGATGHGIHASRFDLKTGGIYAYMHALASRLRRVRVCCGDWQRVLTPSVTTYIGLTGVFLDPPYAHDLRARCYAEDHDISADVRQWALEHGDDPKMRIALCGYDGEHEMPSTWDCVSWKAHGGYSRTERGIANRAKERIWFSPACLRPSDRLQFDAPLVTEQAEDFFCGGAA